MEAEDKEEWIVLSGCNACINSTVCNHLGNCVLLTIDNELPEYNKRKRKLIQKIRTYGNGSMEQIRLSIKKATTDHSLEYRRIRKAERRDITAGWKEEPDEKIIRTWQGPVSLTRLEQLFIAELNRPR